MINSDELKVQIQSDDVILGASICCQNSDIAIIISHVLKKILKINLIKI